MGEGEGDGGDKEDDHQLDEDLGRILQRDVQLEAGGEQAAQLAPASHLAQVTPL